MEDAGCRFIVGSRQSHVPYDLGEHFERHGNYTPDDSTIETSRAMGTGKEKRTRRVVYHYSFKRHKRDDRTINAQIAKAEKVAAGQRPIARDRFVTVTTDADGKKAEVNWAVIERARFCAGFKGYVSNIGTDVLDGKAVVAAYHDLWHVEESFRMAKSDLQARPVFHRKRDSIEAHLTIVFAALAVARYLQDRTGVTITETRPNPPAPANGHHQHRRPASHRPTPPRARRRRDHQRDPRPHGTLKQPPPVQLGSEVPDPLRAVRTLRTKTQLLISTVIFTLQAQTKLEQEKFSLRLRKTSEVR